MRIFLRNMILSGIFFVGASAFAAPERDSREILARVENLASELVANGSTHLGVYNTRTFDYQREIKRVLKNSKREGCSFSPVIGRARGIKALLEFVRSNRLDGSFLNGIHEIDRQGKLRAIVGYVWNGGDGESCSIYSFEIYTTDGWALSLHFDFTD